MINMSAQPDDAKNTAILAALGSVIGYVGAEVADSIIFERLLWPYRFYNYLILWNAIKLAIFMPMGGPLHRAALECLDGFEKNGLYGGITKGDMHGTTFFQDSLQSYSPSSGRDKNKRKDARNLIWIKSLRFSPKEGSVEKYRKDGEEPSTQRTTCFVYHVQLNEYHKPKHGQDEGALIVQEDRFTWKVLLRIICSELTALALAIAIGVHYNHHWLPPLLCVPLTLKLTSLLVHVKRDNIEIEHTDALKDVYGNDPNQMVLFELQDTNHTFFLYEAQPRIVVPFVRHFGHPRRGQAHRIREGLSMLLVYVFILLFPAGLISLIWLPSTLQYFWLGYQAYLIFVMHVSRLFGFQNTGRTEEGISQRLRNQRIVALESRFGSSSLYVSARVLTVYECISVATAKERVDSLFESADFI